MGKRTTIVDAHVGKRLRELRSALGLTAKQLAEIIGVTQQQAHKYESGGNRIPAARLYVFAQALNTPITYFFEGLDGAPSAADQRAILEIARNFSEIANEKHREVFGEVVRLLAGR